LTSSNYKPLQSTLHCDLRRSVRQTFTGSASETHCAIAGRMLAPMGYRRLIYRDLTVFY